MTERLSNTELGELLNVSHATVSRIRSGNRFPSLRVMSKISELTNWSMDAQTKARETGTYAEAFESAFNGALVPSPRAES